MSKQAETRTERVTQSVDVEVSEPTYPFPLYDRVILKRVEEESNSPIIIPDNAKEKPQRAEVLHVGPGRILESGKLHPVVVKPGDKVLFGKYVGVEVKLNGEDVIIMREEDILVNLGP